MDKRDKVLTLFCDKYEGREKEIGCQPIVYGDLILIANELGISIQEVAIVLRDELTQLGVGEE